MIFDRLVGGLTDQPRSGPPICSHGIGSLKKVLQFYWRNFLTDLTDSQLGAFGSHIKCFMSFFNILMLLMVVDCEGYNI